MLERWIIIISGAAFSTFLYFAFVAIIYDMTMQLFMDGLLKQGFGQSQNRGSYV